MAERVAVPRDRADDHTEAMAQRRRDFVAERTGVELRHVGTYSQQPGSLRGNIENFLGVAQVPIGLAGPLRINGEHASGDFYVPLATTEGTLVASYSRGMRLLTAAGGVQVTVVDDRMQRGPVFVLDDARQAREFGEWVIDHFEDIRAVAQSTTRVGRLLDIDQYAVGPLRYLRFNFSTGDAAGQNMVTKATFAACAWIKEHHPAHPFFLLSGSIDTDKKHSQMNLLRGRGKRVIAEVVLPADLLQEHMRVTPQQLIRARQYHATGAYMSGVANNGAHAANALAALFIACGQDVANVSESHAGVAYAQLTPQGDFYWSITLPALIVATVGGGTGLATQRECLAMLGCAGPGNVMRFAEICAAVVLAGDVSLASAILAGEWVAAHERYGRNR